MNEEITLTGTPHISYACPNCGDILQLANGHHHSCRCGFIHADNWSITFAPVTSGHVHTEWKLLDLRTQKDITLGHASCRCFCNRLKSEWIWVCQYHQGFQGCADQQ